MSILIDFTIYLLELYIATIHQVIRSFLLLYSHGKFYSVFDILMNRCIYSLILSYIEHNFV